MREQRRGVVGLEPGRHQSRISRRRLRDRIAARLRGAESSYGKSGNTRPVPVDLVTASGSGLDPHISPAAAEFQVGTRGARARTLDAVRRARAGRREATEGRTLGLLGEPRVSCAAIEPRARRARNSHSQD